MHLILTPEVLVFIKANWIILNAVYEGTYIKWRLGTTLGIIRYTASQFKIWHQSSWSCITPTKRLSLISWHLQDIFTYKYLSTLTFFVLRCAVNLSKPTGHVMHQQFNIQQLYVLPTQYLCFVFIWEQTATCATYSINLLIFITEMKCLLRGTNWVFK